MREISTSIIIEATPEAVWEVLTNMGDYGDWNPFIQELSGHLAEGAQLQVVIAPPGQSPMKFSPNVIRYEEGREFRWLGKLWFSGLFDGEHYFRLEPIDENNTRLVHGELFRGLLVRPILAMMGDNTTAGFEAMNKALKERVEQM